MKTHEWIGTKEAAKLLNVSQRTIQKWVDDGKIMSSKTLGGHRRIKRDDLFTLLTQDHPAAVGNATRPLVVVLVEDDGFTRRLCELSFQAFSTPYRLHMASSGYEGLRLIGQYQPDLLLTDLKMPGIDGFAMIRELQNAAELKHLRIVVITGLEPEEIYRRGGLPETVTILGKPIPFDTLDTIFAQRAATLGIQAPTAVQRTLDE
ncbi:MAG: response regulator [Methylovulum sp.]|nr:response regulator [Methylovulum sp.]